MSISQRQHVRFSLDIPAALVTKYGERRETILRQISIGGCLTAWEPNIYTGDEFRLEVELPNGNRLPLDCKAIYRFEETGIGVRFIDISGFEQELLSQLISERLAADGVPVDIDPFARPPRTVESAKEIGIESPEQERERMLEEAMSGEMAEHIA
jgi:hypothetical protein